MLNKWQKYHAQRRSLYLARKEAGLCTRCGKSKPYPGMVACLDCKKRLRTYERRYLFKLRAMKEQGLTILRCPCGTRAMILCTDCQAPLCDTCYDVGEGRCADCLLAGKEA